MYNGICLDGPLKGESITADRNKFNYDDGDDDEIVVYVFTEWVEPGHVSFYFWYCGESLPVPFDAMYDILESKSKENM